MKKEYTKPMLDAKEYAQFESVFADCNKGNAGIGCIDNVTDWTPTGSSYAAFGEQKGPKK
ncbi:hypothetical protein [Dehalobacter restrictus]|uniref:Uncharacterized protein n=1 Tax=Dehalobacter restrictus TaxID=55583 RepID=A0A857DKH7_9FIRM|nr:hypothetical protein [Dehalobacter restrictus]QHA00949.1 hypothetical protein GQ588_10035 [Dehalobacter restrictus]